MGLLKPVNCLEWHEIKKHTQALKRTGTRQFIRVYNQLKRTFAQHFVWGEEIEVMLCAYQDGYKLLLCAEKIIEELSAMEDKPGLFMPEFAGYMVETTPKEPYSSSFSELIRVEKNIIARLSAINEVVSRIAPGGFVLPMTLFPILGSDKSFIDECLSSPDLALFNYWDRGKNLSYSVTQSKYFPDNAITQHPRFLSFVTNIIKRRGRTLEGYIPTINGDSILIDSMGQGMGCCCLQVTLQASLMSEARNIYDQMAALCPLLLRLTRATPFAQGKLLTTDTRWDMLSMSVDCRTDLERGAKAYVLDPSAPIPKSRFSSVDLYLAQSELNRPEYNDLNVPINEKAYKQLIAGGVDEPMARHIASLFVRDPILIYEDSLERIYPEEINIKKGKIIIQKNKLIIRDGKKEKILSRRGKIIIRKGCIVVDPGWEGNTEEFENIQSSNWRSMRFKLPVAHTHHGGWKIEVRPMEVQPTAFENASFVVFTVLLSRTIIAYSLNFYMPLSLVDENFRRANEHSSTVFYYRENINDRGAAVIKEGTIDEICNGKGDYPGIIPMITRFVSEFGDNTVDKYLDFIKGKSNGTYKSVSEWIRDFVVCHSMYKGDGIISREISDDLISSIKKISEENDITYLLNKK
ncbi:Glutamate--cysteine ligase catalytic subunit [Astathelohania contejeani]|uniref:Glutamate--cysteine ligase n=1 Tax=Astathelohania contejeani TaxID=164912 RepID=A0ABQ7I1V5_9MICR|nr:Glutamate--cysteine ligase catalytic subunit [Thelohania contejeani]